MTAFIPPQQRARWQALAQSAQNPSQPLAHLRELLKAPGRQTQWTAQGAGLTLDYSHQRVTPDILAQLLALAEDAQWQAQRQALFAGEAINRTEGRAVLHVALRGSGQASPPWGAAIAQAVQTELARVCQFAESVRAGQWLGHTGAAITDVVNVGIGGSDLGPRMATQALATTQASPSPVRVHYVSNVDAWSLHTTLATLDPARTGFVVQSKTFTTPETLTLAASAQRWLQDAGCPASDVLQHFVAVTAQPVKSEGLGYARERTFAFWDWVGGRYSVWSAIGLPLVMAIGAPAFRQMLAGAQAMDAHFCEAPAERNLPLLMAVLGIWNRNFLGSPTQHIAAYAWPLLHFTPYLQQMDMESNGKRTHIDGSATEVGTGPIVWGGLGIDGQHAYFQLIHQGQHTLPVDFIGVQQSHCPLPLAAEHDRVVRLNLLAQMQALACGRSEADTQALLERSGMSSAQARELAPHRSFPGNVPSSTIWMERLNPHSLGALMALYEHKVFCQAAIWGIHAYDQWGVELGKSLVQAMEQDQATSGSSAPVRV